MPKPLIALFTSQYRCEEQGGAPRPTPAVPLLTQKRNQKTATRSLWSNPFDCRFSWRRSQSRSLRSYKPAYSLLVQRTAPFTRPEKRQGDLTSFATVACGEPLGCAPFSLQPEPRVVGAGRLQKQAHTHRLSRAVHQPRIQSLTPVPFVQGRHTDQPPSGAVATPQGKMKRGGRSPLSDC